MAVNFRQQFIVDLNIAGWAPSNQNLLVLLHIVSCLKFDAVSLHLSCSNDIFQLQGWIRPLLEVTSTGWQQGYEDVCVSNIDKHIVFQSTESAWSSRRHNVLEPLRQTTLTKLELLKHSEADLKIPDHVVACGYIVLDVELTAYVRVALHIDAIRNDEVINNFGLP